MVATPEVTTEVMTVTTATLTKELARKGNSFKGKKVKK